ncbi:hypothetical protein DMB45_00200 [Sanguibacteroides justesenii]|uniref:gp53-like domain-containing protein n=2 Tax=Porphyromonadaceae TaxID=171551 RepID=UPI000D98ED10|nr:hypothetical protein [Sanguibacteroides justesenii]PXZ44904.1 hypothetical protein DMB45_00200 [Sanguibacteroides justesenii]
MKRHIQVPGVRKWAGEDFIDLQKEPLNVIDSFFEKYGNCVIKGCEVSVANNGMYNVSPGYVALSGIDQDGNNTFKVVPFSGKNEVTLPLYLTLAYNVIDREYADNKVKPIAYNFYAQASVIQPSEGKFLEIGTSEVRQFVDAIHLTEKLDKTGNGRDVTVTFSQETERNNIESGEKLSILWGKVCKWFVDLKKIAFTGAASDIIEDATHRFVTDTEKTTWNGKAASSHTHPASQVTEETNKRFMTDAERSKLSGIAAGANAYTHPASHPASMITPDATHRFVTDTEKTTWNGKAASSHTHPASQVTETTDKRFMTDAERSKLSGIAAGANAYTHPASHPASMITPDATHRFVTDTEKTTWNAKANNTLSNVTLVKSLGSNGYYKAPDGLIIQWGVFSIKAVPHTLSTSFSNTNYKIAVAFQYYNNNVTSVKPYSASKITVEGGPTADVNIMYIAVGY